MKFSLATFCFLAVTPAAWAQSVWEVSRSPNNTGVQITLDWSQASSTGKYRVCRDTDNTPCAGGTVYHTQSKPWTSPTISPVCTTHRFKVKREKMYGGGLIKWWGYVNVGAFSTNIGPRANEICDGLNASADRNEISGSLNLVGVNPTEIRICYKIQNALHPDTHPDLCEMPWQIVQNGLNVVDSSTTPPTQIHHKGYNEVSNRVAGVLRTTNTVNPWNYSIGNLYNSCTYNVTAVLLNGTGVISSFSENIKTTRRGGLSGIFSGFGCTFAILTNQLSQLAAQPDENISDKVVGDIAALEKLLSANRNARIAYLMLTTGERGGDLANQYLSRVSKEISGDEKATIQIGNLMDETGMALALEMRRETIIHTQNAFLAEALLHPEFFVSWQNEMSERGLGIETALDASDDKELIELVSEMSAKEAFFED